MFELTLTYADESTWFAGGFPSEEAALAWLAIEATRPYWVESTTHAIVDKTTEPIPFPG